MARAAVGLVVYKDGGSNTVAVTRELHEDARPAARRSSPTVRIQLVAAQAQFVEDALSNLTQEIIAGGLLSILLILVFLRDWRMSLAIGVMVPLSVLVSLTLLQLLDVTINILSLGGLALAVGLLVDNAIVVAEATGRLREEGLDDWESAQAGGRGSLGAAGRRARSRRCWSSGRSSSCRASRRHSSATSRSRS